MLWNDIILIISAGSVKNRHRMLHLEIDSQTFKIEHHWNSMEKTMPSQLGLGVQLCGVVVIVVTCVVCGYTMFLSNSGEEYIQKRSKNQDERTRQLRNLDKLRRYLRSIEDEDFETMPNRLIWIYLGIGLVVGCALIALGRLV